MKISVCMATYNGASFIKEQLNSILIQLHENDEIILSDDCSIDNTLEIVRDFNDKRILILDGQKFASPILNFENALKYATGDLIFLSDQDDIWLPNKVNKIVNLFANSNISLVVTNYETINEFGKIRDASLSKSVPIAHNFLWDLFKNPYIGCCMAFTRNILELSMPFPRNIAMHDSWIGLLSQYNGNKKCFYYAEPLIQHRYHENNFTQDISTFSIRYRIIYRIRLVINILYRSLNKKRRCSIIQ